MKLLQGFVMPALASAGIASARSSQQQPTEAYILRQSKSTTTSNDVPLLPKDLAQAILLQRLSTPNDPSPLGQLPDSISEDEAVSYINQFAKPARPLFDETDIQEPKQLVIAFAGVTPDEHNALKMAVPDDLLSFTSSGIPLLPAMTPGSCDFSTAVEPQSSECWKDQTQFLQYDAAQNQHIVDELANAISALQSHAASGTMETTILLLAPAGYTTDSDELRRRQLAQEQPMAEHGHLEDFPTMTEDISPAAAAVASSSSFPKPTYPIPACFASRDAAVQGTGNCSGHGLIGDRWASSQDSSCFYCKCLHTYEKDSRGREGLYRWGGNACEKIDVSTPFWLFAGVTIGLVATIAFSISLLFSVGEEKLPGVIGAGVSRSK